MAGAGGGCGVVLRLSVGVAEFHVEFQKNFGEALEKDWRKDLLRFTGRANHIRSKESPKPEISGGRERLAEVYALHIRIFLWPLFIPTLGDRRLIEPLV